MNIIIRAFKSLKEAFTSAKKHNNGLRYQSSTKTWYETKTDTTNTKDNINNKFVTGEDE